MQILINSIKAISGAINFNSLAKDKKQITFYSEGKNYWPYLQKIIMLTLNETNMSICYISSTLDDPGLSIKHPRLQTFFIDIGFIRNYIFQNIDTKIMIMTMPDLDNFQVKRSIHNVHYVYLPHSLVSLHMIYRHGAFDHYNTICCAGQHHVKEIRALEKKYNLPKKNVIELGYPKLENIIEQAKIKKIKKKNIKTILIAPSWGKTTIIESGLGQNIIMQLLNLNYKVIVRPHPQTIKFASKQINKIINMHHKNTNFIFDNHVAGQDSLHESDLMISDWSGVALEYALALNKPVIFCDVAKKINNPHYQDIDLEPIEVSIRNKIGIIWDCHSPITKAIQLCKNRQNFNFDKIKKLNIFPINTTKLIDLLKNNA